MRATGQEVAVKVQRPGALSTISKDLYVMRRAVGVYERIVKRFTAQTTDYQQLLSTFAEGAQTAAFCMHGAFFFAWRRRPPDWVCMHATPPPSNPHQTILSTTEQIT